MQQAPDGQRLAALVSEVDAGRLTLRVAEAFALADAPAAYERFSEGGDGSDASGQWMEEPMPMPPSTSSTTPVM